MGFVRCPNCGALNAASQRMCPQCETRLDLGAARTPSAPQSAASQPVCKQCKHANVFPPVGMKLAPEDVWCMSLNEPRAADGAADDCFEWSFTWRREESLD